MKYVQKSLWTVNIICLLIVLLTLASCDRIVPVIDPVETAPLKLVIGEVKKIDEIRGIWTHRIEITLYDKFADRTYICQMKLDEKKPDLYSQIAVQGQNNAQWKRHILILEECVIVNSNSLL